MSTAPANTNGLVISPCASDHQFLQALFLKNRWSFRGANSLESGRKLAHKVAVVLTETDLHPGTWKDVLAVVEALPNPPLVIVFSVHADEYLWAEALNLGAYDVLAKPFDKLEVTRALGAAWTKRGLLAVERKGMGTPERRSKTFGGNHGS